MNMPQSNPTYWQTATYPYGEDLVDMQNLKTCLQADNTS